MPESRVAKTARAIGRGSVWAGAAFILQGLLPVHADPAYLAIVIDDLGYSLQEGNAVTALPAPVSGAVLPHTPHGQAIAARLHRQGREVLLHLPMQPLEPIEAGPGALMLGMSAREVALTVDYDLTTVPHVVGINSHMGSRLTQDLAAMRKLMQHLRRQGNIFFLDSRTNAQSVAREAAREFSVPFLTRDVFLDSDRTPDAIRAQLARAASQARENGSAIAIGHPYPETLAVLHEALPAILQQDIEIVPLSRMLQVRTARAKPDPAQTPTP